MSKVISNILCFVEQLCKFKRDNSVRKGQRTKIIIIIITYQIISTGIVPQYLFKNLKILDLDNKLVVEIQKGILLYSCHIVRKFLNIDTEHNTQQSQNAEARRR
jgi:hypothetical protein